MYAIEDKYRGAGCSSYFYKIKNSRRGFKAFDSKESATIAHYNQSELAKYNLAPRVYSEVGRVRIGNSKRLSKWGYITEIAQLVCCPGNSCDCCDREDHDEELWNEIINLSDEMESVGFSFPDNHAGNVGYVIRGGTKILVCIDTGDESVQSDDGPCFCLQCKKGKNCREYNYA